MSIYKPLNHKALSMRLVVFILSLFVCFSLSAQLEIIGIPVETQEGEFPILEENISNFEIYRIQNLDRPSVAAQASSFITMLNLGDRSYKLSLYKENLKTSFGKPNKPFCLGGSLNTGGIVSLTINDNFIFGFLKYGTVKYYIEPLKNIEKGADDQLFVFYNVDDVIETGEHVCGVTEVEKRTQKVPEENLKMPTTMCKVVDYAIANTFNMIDATCDATCVMNFNLAVLNDVQTNYRSEFDANLEYDVVAHYVPTGNAGNPYNNPFTGSTNAGFLLGEFRGWARGPGNAGGGNSGGATGGFGVDYTMAGCWTNTDISGGVVGIAYTPGWHHLLENFTSNAASLQVMVSHEIGHNWDAVTSSATGHDPSGSNFIMAPSVTITDNWSAASQSDINGRVSSQTYLDNCSVLGLPNANFFQSALAVCTNEDVEFEDQSQYGATRSWVFTNGTPASSTDEKPTASWAATGLNMVEITSTNGAGSDTHMGYVDIQSEPGNPCTPTSGGGSAGIGSFRLENVNNDSGTTTIYQNFACSDVALLEADTDYAIVFTAVSITSVQYFIDWNNDGDFLDTDEEFPNYSLGNPNATYTLPVFTTPMSPIEGSLLRLRIIGSNSSIGDACNSPSLGEVEDYAIYFEAPQVFGCTDPAANNYDPLATIDDGSCTYGSQTWYEDADSDTFGNPNVSQQSASQPPGYVADNTDCDDTDPLEFPGQTWYKDLDGDTYSDGITQTQCNRPVNYYAASELNGLSNDCDDNNANAFPGNPEVCDGVDNNCDGNIDEGVQTPYYQDSDNDGFGNPNVSQLACIAPPGFVEDNTDCDDTDPLEFPGQIWFKDFDGDQYGDGTSLFQCTRPVDYYAASELISVDLDCDDNNANAFPGNTEVCDGVDNNCDGNIDEGLPLNTYYRDSDNDTYGDPNVTTSSCSAPAGYVLDNTDCDDSNAAINPGATEICDGVDNNCDGNIDEGCNNPPPPCDGTNLIISNVTQNNYHAEVSITSDALVDLGSAVLFTAGTSIDLTAGFEVEAGTPFEAIISPCSTTFDNPDDDGNASSRAIEDKELELIKNQMLESFGPEHQVQFKVLDRWGEQQYSQQSSLQAIGNDGLDSLRQKLEPGQYMVVIKVGDESRRFVLSVAGN